MFTNDPKMKSDQWNIVLIPNPVFDPHMTSRFYKMFPDLFFKKYQYSLWIDGSIELRGNPWPLVEKYLKDHPIAVPKHKGMKLQSPYLEGAHAIKLSKDKPEKILRQLDHYRKMGLPKDIGLWGCHTIFRRHNDLRCKKLCRIWWQQLEIHSRRDQISFPYAVWYTGVTPGSITGKDKGYLGAIAPKIRHLK